jgi:hypothetical protein
MTAILKAEGGAGAGGAVASERGREVSALAGGGESLKMIESYR